MIPRIIHYCWFGGKPKPELAKKCIASWKKFCPDYDIIEWNEDNFDIQKCPLYVRQAYEAKKWAFVSDYVRLKVVYDQGGVYLDTDVELKKNINGLLHHNGFFGFEDGVYIATGLGFGAVKGLPILLEMMNDYNEIPFLLENGQMDMETCPVRNTRILTEHGLRQDNSLQTIANDVLILPSEYLCPYSYETGTMAITPNTLSVHWFDASWRTEEEKKYREEKIRKEKMDYLRHLPNRILMKLLGDSGYSKLKKFLKRG